MLLHREIYSFILSITTAVAPNVAPKAIPAAVIVPATPKTGKAVNKVIPAKTPFVTSSIALTMLIFAILIINC